MIANPFLNKETGQIAFPYQPTRDVCFVLPCLSPERIGSFFIPDEYKDNHRDEYGIVLAIGKGCYIEKFKKYVPTITKVGDTVIYDSSLPFDMDVMAPDGIKYRLRYMGERDISGVIRN